MKKIIVIIVFFILIFSNQLFSQPISELDKILQNQTDEKFDNLQIYINNVIKEKDYIEQMNILEKCIFQLLDLKEFQEAKKYAIIASNLANQKQNFSDLSFFENTTGSINYYLGNFIEVEENYKKALDACYKTQDNFKISKALNNLNTIYTKLGKTDLAIKGFLESIKIKESINDTIGIAITYTNIGNLFFGMTDYQNSLKYLEKANSIASIEPSQKFTTLLSLSKVHRKLGNFEDSKNYLTEIKSLNMQFTDFDNLSLDMAYGALYFLNENYKKSIDYYNKSLSYKDVLNTTTSGLIYTNLLRCNLNLGRISAADKVFSKLIKVLPEIGGIHEKKDIYNEIAFYYHQKKNYKKEIIYLNKYNSLKDSLFYIDKERTVSEIKTKFETEKKEKSIELLKSKNALISLRIKKRMQIILVLGVFIVVILLLIILLLLRQKQVIRLNVSLIESQNQLQDLNNNLNERVKEEIAKQRAQEQKVFEHARLAALGELAAGIAHEINQPLHSINFTLENAEEAMETGNVEQDYLERKIMYLKEDAERIGKIINNIRTFSRKQVEEDNAIFSINQSITNAVGMVNKQYEKYRIDIQLNLVKKLPKVFGNIYKLEQVLLNLLSNSKDALLDIDNKRLIKISTNLIDDSIQIVFCDNGEGIPAEIIQKIFIPFYTTKDPGKGTGLGLSITFGIINNMNGSIIIDENYTTGTQFIIKIPISNKMEK